MKHKAPTTKGCSSNAPDKKDPLKEDPNKEDQNDLQMFQDAVSDITPLSQDKVVHPRRPVKQARTSQEKNRHSSKEKRRINAAFQFSDGFEAWFDPAQPLKFSRSKTLSGEVKRLRRGEYPPDITLDLHGYNREDAKWEIAEFLHVAIKHHHYCVCIVHGIGSRILKQQIPNWLVQHPNVLGFHEAPLEWGGKGALLILLDVMDPESGEWRAR